MYNGISRGLCNTYREGTHMAEFASKGVGNAGLTTGIIGAAGWLLNGGLSNILGGNCGCAAAMSGESAPVSRYEAAQSARIAELESEVKLRDSTIYTDGKMIELYRYIDGKLEGVNAAICQQNVYNATNTAQLSCMAGQIAQLMSLTKLVIPNGSVCPGWGEVTVAPKAAAATTA